MKTKTSIPSSGKIRFSSETADAIKVIVTGDLCPIESAEQKLAQGNAAGVFGDLLGELTDKDLAITNLELALTEGGEPIYKAGPNLRATPAVLSGINKAGFDVYALANNHSRDFGDAALLETVNHIKAVGKEYVGAGVNIADARKSLSLEVKEQKVCILNICMHNDCDATRTTPGVNILNPARNAVEIMQAKKEHDYVIVIVHDGKEQNPFPSPRMIENYRAYIDAGASAVIGHHPHIPQGFEYYNDGLIAYSLGNFLFPPRAGTKEHTPEFWYTAYSVRLHLADGKVCALDIIPHTLDKESYCLSVLQGDARNSFFQKISDLNALLLDEEKNEIYFRSRSRYFHENYDLTIKNYSNAIKNLDANDPEFKKAAHRFEHHVVVEEHFDTISVIANERFAGNCPDPDDVEKYI
jgi:poly-gamma-glutamate capsule biosynthesis protein CapA/YwtB (metallophosphatase superfamily)